MDVTFLRSIQEKRRGRTGNEILREETGIQNILM
jgi:hypothetical protein